MTDTPPVRRLADWDFDLLDTVARDVGTPAYVLDLERAAVNYERIAAAFPDADVYYAAKANTAPGLLNALADRGAGAVCASVYELDRLLAAGFAPEKVCLTAVNPPESHVARFASRSVDNPELTMTVGALDTVDKLVDAEYTGDIYLRINHGRGLGYATEDATASKEAKFGLPAQRLDRAYEKAEAAGMTVAGVHAHVGSGILGGDEIEEYVDVIGRVAQTVSNLDFEVETLNIGGGFGVPHCDDEEPLDLGDLAGRVRDATAPFDGRLVLEPGRYIAADAGTLLLGVTTAKSMDATRVVGVDAGFDAFTRHLTFDAYHGLANVSSPENPAVAQSVSGPTCSGADVFASDRVFPRAERGDVLALGHTGAYGRVAATNFHGLPDPPVVTLQRGGYEVDIARQTDEEVNRHL